MLPVGYLFLGFVALVIFLWLNREGTIATEPVGIGLWLAFAVFVVLGLVEAVGPHTAPWWVRLTGGVLIGAVTLGWIVRLGASKRRS